MNAFTNAPESKKRLTLAALFCGLFGSILISSTQSTMLPVAALEIGGETIYSLVATLSGIVSVIVMPLFGYFAAKNPAVKPRLFSVSMFLSAIVIFIRSIASNMWMIILPGMLYGFASAAIYVIGYSYIRDIYDSKKAAYYLGFVATMQSIGQIAGPVIGGFIMDHLGWRYLNHLIWPFLFLAGILAVLGVNVSKEDVKDLCKNVTFDFWGAISLGLFLGCFSLALSIGTSFAPFGGLASNLMLLTSLIALISLIVSISVLKEKAFLPLGVLKERNTLCLAVANLFTNLHTMAAFFFLPMFAIYVLQTSATASGLITSAFAVAGLFMGPVWGKMIGKSGTAKNVYLIGTGIRIAITVIFIFILNENCSIYLIYGLMLVAGLYNSQTGVTFAAAPQLMIKEENRIMGNSVIQICQSVGSTVAVALYTLIIGIFGVADGIRTAFMISLVFAVIAFIAGLLMAGSSAKEK
ncbi:MAG: MFS transporter [Lachnospiraceae bacterium]|nr:MFS transporter [Lachnospiraceae bacterium]